MFYVISESGRLFVWGLNQYRQLGIGPKDMITKPTVVRKLRDNGVKVKDVAFGYQFTVVLSGSIHSYSVLQKNLVKM